MRIVATRRRDGRRKTCPENGWDHCWHARVYAPGHYICCGCEQPGVQEVVAAVAKRAPWMVRAWRAAIGMVRAGFARLVAEWEP